MDQQAPSIYDPDASITQNLNTAWERLAARFKPEDFVRVMNIDDETFYWQSLDPRDERVQVEGDQFMQMKNTIREKPKMWSIPAGATMVLEGWNAAIMIEKLFKKVVAKKKLGSKPEGTKVTTFAWSTPALQEEYFNKIFVGIERPEFSKEHQTAPEIKLEAEPTVMELAKELGLASE